jgi:hypothetical protein
LFSLAVNDGAISQARAITILKINQLKNWLDAKARNTVDEGWKSHYSYESGLIASFLDDPTEFKTQNLSETPPGQPIGQTEGFCEW